MISLSLQSLSKSCMVIKQDIMSLQPVILLTASSLTLLVGSQMWKHPNGDHTSAACCDGHKHLQSAWISITTDHGVLQQSKCEHQLYNCFFSASVNFEQSLNKQGLPVYSFQVAYSSLCFSQRHKLMQLVYYLYNTHVLSPLSNPFFLFCFVK